MKTILTKSEQELLIQHDSVESCTQKYIRYTPAFKEEVIRQYQEGVSSEKIFSSIPLPERLNTPEYRKTTLQRWKRMREEHGIDYVHRKQGNGGMSLKYYHQFDTWYESLDEKHKLEYLEAENEILKTVPLTFRKPRLWELYEKLSQSGKSEILSSDARREA